MSSQATSSAAAWRLTFDRTAQIKVALIVVAFVAAFWQLLDFNPGGGLGELTHAWWNDLDWSHGPIIPLFSAYLAYMRWEQIRRSPPRYTWVGLVLLLLGLAFYQYTLWGLLFGYLRPMAMMLCLLGVIIYLCGLPVMRHAWLPWLYLFFAIPIPGRIYFYLTDPLQRLAAAVASGALELFPDLHVKRLGIMIHALYQGQVHELSVSDACSGMRSTMVLCALGTAIAFMTWRPWWHRAILLAACVPIATLCNCVRVFVTSYLHIFVGARYATGTYHMALGLLVILLAMLIFLGIGWVLSNLFVEEREAEPAAQRPGRGGGERS